MFLGGADTSVDISSNVGEPPSFNGPASLSTDYLSFEDHCISENFDPPEKVSDKED